MRRRRRNPVPFFIFGFLFLFWVLPQLISGMGMILTTLFALALIVAGVRMLTNEGGFGSRLQGARNIFYEDRRTVRPERKKRDESPQSAAVNRALNRARMDDFDLDVDLLDIGLLVYEDDSHPKIFRMGEVPNHASHVRPFIVVQPHFRDGREYGVIRFNLLDGNRQLRYTSRARYRLKGQANFVTPSTWLPIKDETPNGDWSLQVNVGDGPPIAIHEFRWFEVGGALGAQFNGDGELDERTQRLMQESTKGLLQ